MLYFEWCVFYEAQSQAEGQWVHTFIEYGGIAQRATVFLTYILIMMVLGYKNLLKSDMTSFKRHFL